MKIKKIYLKIKIQKMAKNSQKEIILIEIKK